MPFSSIVSRQTVSIHPPRRRHKERAHPQCGGDPINIGLSFSLGSGVDSYALQIFNIESRRPWTLHAPKSSCQTCACCPPSLSAQYTEAITHPVTHPRSIDDTTKAQEVPEMASFSRRHRVASHAAPLVAGPNSEGRLDHLIKFKREGEREESLLSVTFRV